MKVLLVSREYPPESPGGLGNATRNLALGLLTQGVTPIVLSSSPHGGAGGRLSFGEYEGVKVARIAPKPFRLPWEPGWFWHFHDLYYPLECRSYSRLVGRACKKIVEEESVAVVQFADYRGEGFCFMRQNPRFPSVVRLATPYYMVEEINARGRNEKPRLAERMAWNLMRSLEAKSIRAAKALASPSASLAEIISRETKPRGSVRIIHTGIDTDHFTRRPREEVTRYRRGLGMDDGPVVLFTGRYEYRKGVHTLLTAFAEVVRSHPECTLVTAGGDTETAPSGGSMKSYLAESARRLGLGRKLLMLDRVPYDELPILYSSADIFVAPSLYENFANTLLEAMSCGLPLISTTSGGAPEIIEEGSNGRLVPPESPDALAEAMVELMEDDEARRRMAKKNIAKARKSFTREAMAKGFASLYRELA